MTKGIARASSPGLDPRQYLTLLELSKAIGLHRNLPNLFHDLSGRLHDVLECHNLSIVLHDESLNVLRAHILETNEPAMREFLRELPIEGSISGWVWRNQKPFVTADVHQETRFAIVKLVRDYPVTSVCCLPLTTARSRLGVLLFWSDKPGAYDRLDLEFAQLVASRIAVAVENALNFEEAQSAQQQLAKERDQLRLLLDVGSAVVSTLDLRELMTTVATCLRRVMSHGYASLALYDSDNNTLQIHALDFPEGRGLLQEGITVPLEDAPSGLAIKTRETVLLTRADVEQMDSEFARRGLDEGFQSGCFVPLIAHGRPLGVLVVASRTEAVFPQTDAELLQPVANQIAIAVENALGFCGKRIG